MKSTNEKLFAILDKMFPGEFEYGKYNDLLHYNQIEYGLDYDEFTLDDAFWLAEKVDLFSRCRLGKNEDSGHWEVWYLKDMSLVGLSDYLTSVCYGSSLQETLVNAIVEIYGEK